MKKGELAVDPLRKITRPKKKKPLPVFLREGEMDKLLDEIDFGEGFEGCRDHLIIEMFYATGIRLSELIDLDDRGVDFSASLIKTGSGFFFFGLVIFLNGSTASSPFFKRYLKYA